MTAATTEIRRTADRDERSRLAAQESDEDFVRLMGAEWGRRVIWRLLGSTDNRQTLFATNATLMAHNASLRDFGRREITDRAMKLCPELYVKMHRENR